MLSGVLISPITTIYYDSGFPIGLQGVSVAAIIGGLASYPLAAFGAVLVGLLESFSRSGARRLGGPGIYADHPGLVWRS